MSWNVVTHVKKHGRLCVRMAREVNVALLRKLMDSSLYDKEKFWARVLTNAMENLRIRKSTRYGWNAPTMASRRVLVEIRENKSFLGGINNPYVVACNGVAPLLVNGSWLPSEDNIGIGDVVMGGLGKWIKGMGVHFSLNY
ncbi:hypothetical protein RJT34_04369 [Clitoria ternatea]|uniref:Uncharacterized protein n=1 Tax=Clitoria ternatea TaxID=43366 RepID=A0AAN9KND4_CLITE